MQEHFEFAQKDHSQGGLPLGMEQTAPEHFMNRRHAASIQYAYSIKTSRVKERDFPYDGRQITSTSELLQFAGSMRLSDIEKMLSIYLDAQNQVLAVQINTGTVNHAVVYPREIVRHALLVGATGFILIHNHPSGHVRPSDADIRMTKTIQETCKPLDLLFHDHLILGPGARFFSFREEGMM